MPAAEQNYHAMRDELTTLTGIVRALLAERFTEVHAVTDVWLTLLSQDRRAAAFLGATAIVRLAKAQQSETQPGHEPGSS